MSTPRFLAVAVCALSIAACNPFNRGDAVELSASDPTLNSSWHANLASPSGLAGAVQMTGSVTMAPGPDDTHTRVTLDLANASPGGLHPWALHQGQCSPGRDYGVFGRTDAYSPMTVDSDGRARADATLSERIPQSGEYFVAVYASRANPGTVVACGNLAAPTR